MVEIQNGWHYSASFHTMVEAEQFSVLIGRTEDADFKYEVNMQPSPLNAVMTGHSYGNGRKSGTYTCPKVNVAKIENQATT